jgi:hypothetical protein
MAIEALLTFYRVAPTGCRTCAITQGGMCVPECVHTLCLNASSGEQEHPFKSLQSEARMHHGPFRLASLKLQLR